MARKLAYLQRIKELNPIPGADLIEVASIQGWKVVVQKNQFKVNDLCVYVEIDAILPDKPEFEFLRIKKFRIRTVRLKGQISQGICFPISILPPNLLVQDEGTDLTEALGIEQYIPQIPACIAGEVKGSFPSFIPKTDETRVQVLETMLNRYKGTPCYVTEKVDGSSVTYYIKDGEFGVCSRNLELKDSEENAFWKMAKQLKIEEKLKALNYNIAIQGELIGPGINKNNLKLPEHHVLFFTAFDIDKYEYYNGTNLNDLLISLELESVPFLEMNYQLEDNINKLVEKAKGFSKLNPKVFREGIVIRPMKEMIDLQMSNDWGNGRVSFKVINPEYLLKYEE